MASSPDDIRAIGDVDIDALKAELLEPLPTTADDLLLLCRDLTGPIGVVIALRDACYARQTRAFEALRALKDGDGKNVVTYGQIAEAAGVSEEAVIRRLRPSKPAAAPKPTRATKKR